MLPAFALVLVACAGEPHSSLRLYSPPASGIMRGHLEPGWVAEQLRRAALDLQSTFASEGGEGLLRLRLRSLDVDALFNDQGAQRIRRLPTGLTPAPGEQRWLMFRRLAHSPIVGFCARGVRLAEPNGPEGLRERGLVVDRLLLVGSEADGVWGAWVEGLTLTNEGWRLLPTVPFDRAVETPRRDHADVQLWDCDVGHRAEPGRAI